MDQERHNLPWNGSYSTSCAAIAWNKVDDTAGHNALGGTSWTVYGKKDDAVNGTNALATIADGGWNDDADAEGSFQLGNLAKNGTYFLKESGTAEGYAQNTNITRSILVTALPRLRQPSPTFSTVPVVQSARMRTNC